jgi:hypothetical protein
MAKVSKQLAELVARSPGSNQYLLFQSLLVEDLRSVRTSYYFNSLHLLGYLALSSDLASVSYPIATPISKIYADYVELLVFHLMSRPALRLIWALEAVSRRLCKRLLLSADHTRSGIKLHVEFERFLNSEERNAFLAPSPASTLMQLVEKTTQSAVGRFFARHYDREKNFFGLIAAQAEYRELERAVVSLESATEETYLKLKKSLGNAWSELTFADSQNRSFDRLGHGVCEVISFYPSLMPALSDRAWARVGFLASLGNHYAKVCLQGAGRPEPPPHAYVEAELKKIFDPAHHEQA